jgi:hypothetical protein
MAELPGSELPFVSGASRSQILDDFDDVQQAIRRNLVIQPADPQRFVLSFVDIESLHFDWPNKSFCVQSSRPTRFIPANQVFIEQSSTYHFVFNSDLRLVNLYFGRKNKFSASLRSRIARREVQLLRSQINEFEMGIRKCDLDLKLGNRILQRFVFLCVHLLHLVFSV